jgi:hypothetical protein
MHWVATFLLVAGANESPTLEAAERAYDAGQYDTVLSVLQPAAADALPRDQRGRA